MSAFLVSDLTMSKVVSQICSESSDSTIWQELTEICCERQPQALGERLKKLNEQAVFARYGNEDELPGHHGRFSFVPVAPTLVEAYKALCCLLYQCSEGDVPETALFQALEDYRDCLARKIVRELPEYEAAPWD